MTGTTPNFFRRAALLALLVPLALGCASTRPGGEAPEPPPDPNVVEADDVRGRAISRVEEMLRGQVAGVSVYETPRGLIIRIRGASSVYADSDPLFVIDGLPLQLGDDGALVGINPSDIESIRVLKNASETAMYGVRGGNGVVLITTKRPPLPVEEEDVPLRG